MDKRTFIKITGITGSALLLNPSLPLSAMAKDEVQFEQIKLPYGYDALEPYIDAQTMELHYGKHHAGYTSKFNTAIKDNGLEGKSIDDIFKEISSLPSSIRNNGGGYYNHNLFWQVLSPKSTKPSGDLLDAINASFGSLNSMKENFSQSAGSVFGSGWTWLVKKNGKLVISTSPNQDNPLMDVAEIKGKPILALDVWEHAYYLKYQNKRKEYISAFWNVVNWENASELFIG